MNPGTTEVKYQLLKGEENDTTNFGYNWNPGNDTFDSQM